MKKKLFLLCSLLILLVGCSNQTYTLVVKTSDSVRQYKAVVPEYTLHRNDSVYYFLSSDMLGKGFNDAIPTNINVKDSILNFEVKEN